MQVTRPKTTEITSKNVNGPPAGKPRPKACALLGRNRPFTLAGMRMVIQRVTQAQVTIDGLTKGAIGQGLLILVGIEESDSTEDVVWLSGKVSRLRIFDDAEGVMNLSVQEIGGDVLLISQFTLFASTRKGNRPSYSRSAAPAKAIPLYEALVAQLTLDLGKSIQTGEFGADMQVSLVNSGPVTIVIDSKSRE